MCTEARLGFPGRCRTRAPSRSFFRRLRRPGSPRPLVDTCESFLPSTRGSPAFLGTPGPRPSPRLQQKIERASRRRRARSALRSSLRAAWVALRTCRAPYAEAGRQPAGLESVVALKVELDSPDGKNARKSKVLTKR